MKNITKLLFAGILAAFLMLAVPFAVVSFDADDANAEVSVVNVDTEDNLRSQLETEGPVSIKITDSFSVTSEINVAKGNKILDLNGCTLTSNSVKLFIFEEKDQGSFTINGNNGAITVDCDDDDEKVYSMIVYSKTTATGFTLNVNGGSYDGAEYAFTLYSTNYYENNIVANFSGVKINGKMAIWCGNGGVDSLSMTNCEITSSHVGLYLGSVNDVTLDNVTINSDGTAVEIKSGDVKITNSTIIGGQFNGNVTSVGSSTSGAAVAPIVINNYYCKEAVADGVSVTIDDDTVIGFSDDTANVPMVIVAAGQKTSVDKIYPINVTWNDAEYVAGYAVNAVKADSTTAVTFDSNDSSIVVNGFTLVDNAYKLTEALKAGNNVRLLNDINVANGVTFEIKKSLIVDGSGYKISSSGPNGNASDFRLFDIILADGEVTIENLTLDLAGGNKSRTLNIRSADGLVVNVIDSTINNGTHYAINITGSCKDVELNIIRTEIIDSTNDVKGYCAIQTWSEKADINITNSKIYGNNTYDGVSNAFGAIVVNPLSEANITITDSKIITKDVDSENAPEYSILYKGDSKGKLKLVGDVEFKSEGVTKPRILLSEGGWDWYNGAYVELGKSSATIEVSGIVTKLNSLNLPVGCTFTMEPGSVFSGTINGPEGASIGFNNVKAGNDGIVITAGSLSINGSMSSVNSGTITLNGSNVKLSGTVESGVTINVAPGCKPTIVDSLRFEAGSSLVSNVPANEVFAQGSGDVYYDAGSKVNNNSIVEDQKINASTGASYEKVTVFLKTNGPMYPDQSSIEVFVGDYYMDTLDGVVFYDDMGYILEGWYTEFGLKITDLTKANNSITTLVANFVYDPSSAPVSPGAPGSTEPEESSGFDIADHVVLIEAVIAVLVLIGFVAYIRKN